MNFIYILCKLIIYPSLRFYFKHSKVIGLEKLVNNRPVILYSNHNNAFLDSIVLHYAFRENIYTLTRGDVFSNRFTSYLLSQFHILPVYRFQEGYENLQKNNATFEKTKSILHRKNKILIFPEGNCIQEKKLRKFKKGMARIAFDFKAQNKLDQGLVLQPIALNYSHPWRLNGALEIVVGEPISVNDYNIENETNSPHAIKKLNEHAEAALANLLVVVNDSSLEEAHYTLCSMLGEELHSRKSIALQLNNLSADSKTRLIELVKEYTNNLKTHNIRDWVVAENELGYGKQMLNGFLLLILLPFFLVGAALNYVNYTLPYYITRKTCKHKEFYSSVNIASAAFVFLITYTFYLFISSAFIKDGYLFLLNFLVMPITGFIAYQYQFMFRKLKGKLNWLYLIRNKKFKAESIIQTRQSILELFG